MSEDITVSPFYHSSVNEITKPGSLVFTSHYFADRWLRDLGPVGTALVIVLRSHCYQNRATGELRNRIQLPVAQIAAEAGVSPKTVRREMEANRTLQKFIQRREEYAPGPTPQSLRTDAYSYLVAMDDPVHPLDQELLQEAIRDKAQRMEKGGGKEDARTREEDAKSRARQRQQPRGQIDQTATGGLVRMTTPLGQSVPATAKLSTPPGQNDHALIDSSDSSESNKNPSSDFSLSLFQEGEGPPSLAWKDLPETEQSPWRDRALQELVAIHAGTGITPGKMLVEVRARNIYALSLKGTGTLRVEE